MVEELFERVLKSGLVRNIISPCGFKKNPFLDPNHMFESFTKKKDRSLSYLHVEAATSSVENAGMGYQSPSLLAAGATARDIALLSTFTNLIFSLVLFKIPGFIKLGDSLKRVTIILGVISVLSWIPMILVTILIKSVSPALLITLWVISLIPTLIDGPIRDKWMADLIPGGRIGRYLSLRSAISAGTFLVSFYMLGYILDHYKVGIFSGFPLVYMITLAGCMGSLLMYFLIHAPAPLGEDEEPALGLKAFFREAKQNDIGMFIVYSTLVILTASISGAFFSVYMLQDLHFTYLTFTIIISVEFLARIVSLSFWGKMVDKVGAIKVLRLVSILIPVVPCLWLFSSNIVYLMAVQCLSGLSWAAYDLCIQSYICGASPKTKRLHYIVYHRSIVTMATAIGPLAGSYLLNVMFPVFGNPILGIFLLSGILRMVVVIAVLPRLKDTGVNSEESESQQYTPICTPRFESRQEPEKEWAYTNSFSRASKSSGWEGRQRAVSADAPIAFKETRQEVKWHSSEHDYETLFRKPEPVTVWKAGSQERNVPSGGREEIARKLMKTPKFMGNIPQDRLLRHPERWRHPEKMSNAEGWGRLERRTQAEKRTQPEDFRVVEPVLLKNSSEIRVSRLSDNLSRDIEYHRRWASKVTGND
jgi:hypothetical protein